MRLKAVAAFVLLALLVGGAGALAILAQPKAGASGLHHVRVDGQRGVLFDGDVDAPNATALSALQATGLNVTIVAYPGMGAYVSAVGGQPARGASGWVFEVSDGDGWRVGDRSAALTPLDAGQGVRWRWSDAP